MQLELRRLLIQINASKIVPLYSKIVDYSGCEGKEIKYQMPSSKGLSDIYVDGTVPEGGSGKGFIFLVEMLIISFAVLLYA